MLKYSTLRMSMMTNQQTDNIADNVHAEIQKSAIDVSSNVAIQLAELADLLEKVAPNNYGLLVTSLRWHASRTASNEFLSDYCRWVADNLNYEYS